jgi:hypothetical protein
MPYNELRRLKLFLVDAWAESVMPVDPATDRLVPIDYAWPGPYQKPTHVWFYNGRVESDYGPMGAGTKRRDQTVTFNAVIECTRVGKTVDAEGRNVLQQQADEMVEMIAGRIDQWVAQNPTLGQTVAGMVPVDFARFQSFELAGGPTTNGVGTTGLVQISYRTRPK